MLADAERKPNTKSESVTKFQPAWFRLEVPDEFPSADTVDVTHRVRYTDEFPSSNYISDGNIIPVPVR